MVHCRVHIRGRNVTAESLYANSNAYYKKIAGLFIKSSSQELLGKSLQALKCSIYMVLRWKIWNVIPPSHGDMILGQNCKIDVFSSSLLLIMYQINWIYSNDKQGRIYQNCKCHDPRGRGSSAWAWPQVIKWKCIISFKYKIFFSTCGHKLDKLRI